MHVTAANLYAVLLGNNSALSGGSGKVVDSKPNDRIFLFYSDHGGPGVLGMLKTLFVLHHLYILRLATCFNQIRPNRHEKFKKRGKLLLTLLKYKNCDWHI